MEKLVQKIEDGLDAMSHSIDSKDSGMYTSQLSIVKDLLEEHRREVQVTFYTVECK